MHIFLKGNKLRFSTLILACVGLGVGPAGAQVADVIYTGGDVVTMNQRQPVAEAVAVRGGKVLAVGSRVAVMTHRGAGTKVVNLAGRTLVPGFIDPHSHFSSAMAISEQANCSAPPVGPVKDIPGLVAALKAFREARRIKPGGPIVGYGYERDNLAEGRELTRDDLDPAFPDNPVIVTHVSMHGAVLNSVAMRKFGVSATTATPPGGIIARRPGSNEPAGLLMETAYLPVFAALSAESSPERELARLRAGQMIYAAAGITTAQEAPRISSNSRSCGAGRPEAHFFSTSWPCRSSPISTGSSRRTRPTRSGRTATG